MQCGYMSRFQIVSGVLTHLVSKRNTKLILCFTQLIRIILETCCCFNYEVYKFSKCFDSNMKNLSSFKDFYNF